MGSEQKKKNESYYGLTSHKGRSEKNLSEPLLEITFSSKDLEISFSYWFDKFFLFPMEGKLYSSLELERA